MILREMRCEGLHRSLILSFVIRTPYLTPYPEVSTPVEFETVTSYFLSYSAAASGMRLADNQK